MHAFSLNVCLLFIKWASVLIHSQSNLIFYIFICFSFVLKKISIESGRLFVWGENQYGQLSAGSKEVITKPSCAKEINKLGHKVRNIAFGEAFSVILTGRTKKQPFSNSNYK